MKKQWWITAVTTLFLFGASTLAAVCQPPNSLGNLQKLVVSAAYTEKDLDSFVRRYAKTVRSAASVEALAGYLPKERLRKFRNDYSDRQKSDWLRFRRQMPYLGKLVSQKAGKEKAVLIYETPDEKLGSRKKKQKRLAEITLIKEGRQWKVFLEHFGPAKEIMHRSR